MNRAGLEEIGRALAERHAEPVEPRPEHSLLNYAEMPRGDDWSMRSALVRFAQPQPVRSGQLLELVRRLDAVLHHVARPLEKRTVLCDRSIGAAIAAGSVTAPTDPYPDTRTADLARVGREIPDGLPTLVAAYTAVIALDPEELGALPLLGIALEFDALAEVLTDWAVDVSDPPPAGAVDATCTIVGTRMDELGVPVEEYPPGRGGRPRRG